MARLGTRFVAAALSAVLVACSAADPPTPQPSDSQLPAASAPALAGRIDVTPSAVLLTGAGQTAQLAASAFGQDGAPVSVTWSSSDPAQVSVDPQGKVTAVSDLGSAVIYADAGDRSTPVAVLIAQPPQGAVLVGDAQVVNQPQPLGSADSFPANGDRYRVTLTGVDAPAAGTILLATGSAEVAGRVVTASAAGANVDVEYELVPLPQLFARYSIDLDLPLDPRDAIPGVEASQPAFTAALARPGEYPDVRLAVERKAEKEAEFKKGPLTCKASAAAKFNSTDFNIKATTDLTLQVEGRKSIADTSTPEHTKVVLTGPLALDVSGGLRAEAGFEGKAECELKYHIPIPLGGVLAVVLAITVPIGLSASAEGKVKAVDIALGPKGHLGTTATVGFQCDSTACWAITEHTPDQNNGIEFESKVNLLPDMRVDASVALNVITGLGARVGTADYSLIDVKVGPVQSFSLAFDDAQARETAYASNYDLKLVASVAPGDDLKTAISRLFGGAVTLDLSAKYSPPEALAQSPKGTLSAEKARVQVDKPVKLSIDIDPKTLDYLTLPNLDYLRIDRWKDGVLDELQKIPISASGQTHFEWTWTPEHKFLGMNELVAFVVTKGLPLMPLEIAPDSRAYVEVVDACLADPPTPAPPPLPGATIGPVPPNMPAPDPCAPKGSVTYVYHSTYNGEFGSFANDTWTATVEVKLRQIPGEEGAFEDDGSTFSLTGSHTEQAFDSNGCFLRRTYEETGGGAVADGGSIAGWVSGDPSTLSLSATVLYSVSGEQQYGGGDLCGQETTPIGGESTRVLSCEGNTGEGIAVDLAGRTFDMACSWQSSNDAYTFDVQVSGTVEL